jgi:hypothetical protein
MKVNTKLILLFVALFSVWLTSHKVLGDTEEDSGEKADVEVEPEQAEASIVKQKVINCF